MTRCSIIQPTIPVMSVDSLGLFRGRHILLVVGFLLFAGPVFALDQDKVNNEANVFKLADVTNTSTADDMGGEVSGATGLLPMTAEAEAEMRKHAHVVKKVRLNKIGLARINEERAKKNLKPLVAGRDLNVAPVDGDMELSAAGGGTATATGGTTATTSDGSGGVVAAGAAFPSGVDNSTLKFFPPIGNQGKTNSCVAWAEIYYTMTHEMAMQYDWDAKASADNRFAPMFTYNFVNGGSNVGTGMLGHFNIAHMHGVPRLSEFSTSSVTAWPTNSGYYRRAIDARTDGWGTVGPVNTSAGLDTLKAFLANGHVAAFATKITNAWQYKKVSNDPATTADDAYVGNNIASWYTGTTTDHVMTVVGFNDNIWCDANGNSVVDADEKGAVRIANSWGTGWTNGNNGFCWVSYRALLNTNIFSGGYVYFGKIKPTQHAPKVVAKVTLNHNLRNQVFVQVGTGSVGSTSPSSTVAPQILTNDGGAYAFSGAAAASEDFTYYLDFTDIVPSIGTAKRWFVQAADSGSNNGDLTIKNFELYAVSGNIDILVASATNTPQLANGTTKYAYVDWTMGNVPTVVNWSVASQTSTNESGSLTVTAQLSAVSTQTVTVPFTISGTAIAGTDYTISASSLSIPAGSLAVSTTINIIADAIDEANETVIVTMGTPTNASKGSQSLFIATITDDDAAPTVAFQSASATTSGESGTMVATVQLSAVSGQLVTVPFTTSGTATNGADYTISASSLTIPAGSLTASATIAVVGDALDEANETVILTMGTPTNATKGTAVKYTATITDDDAMPMVVLASTGQTSTAESGTMTVTALLSVVSGRTVTVPLTLTGTATKGSDYSISTTSIAIPAGSTTGTTTITILDDALDEVNETIIVTMGSVTTATKGTPNVFTGTITDDDGLVTPPVVAWATASQSTAESGTATVTAQLSVVSSLPVTVPFAVTGTATSGTDYTISASPLTIPAGSLTASATITVIGDALDEANDTIILTMGTPTNATKGSVGTHTATITDDDAMPTVVLTSTGQTSTAESGTMTVTALLSVVSGRTVTVPLTLTGTATKGPDYSISTTSIAIPAGSTTGTATITILDDAFDEVNETIIVTIGSVTTATKGTPNVFTGTIADDDGLATPPVVAWTTASQSTAESGTATVTAQLSVVSPLPVTVPFTVTGTAKSGTDYTISASPLTIPAGSLTASATITIIGDALDEANETIILTMGTPTNATKGSLGTHTATITDDDATPTVTFTSTSQTSTLESGTMTVTVQLSAVSGMEVQVPFTLTGTATKGTDYTITASPIKIPAGSLTASATITIIADSIDEADETVIMTMGTPINATKGATTVHTATISDAPSVPASNG